MPRAHQVGLAWPVSLALRVQSKRSQPAGAQGRCYCGARLYRREPGAKKPVAVDERNAGRGPGGFWSLLLRLSRTRRSGDRRSVRGSHVSTHPVAGLAASTTLQRWAIEVGDRQRPGPFWHACFERHAERRGDLVDRLPSSSFATGGQPWRTRRLQPLGRLRSRREL